MAPASSPPRHRSRPRPGPADARALLDRPFVFVTGQGRLREDDRRRLARHRGRCERPAGARVRAGRRAHAPARVRDRRPARRGPPGAGLWCLSIDPHDALVEWLRAQPGGAVAAGPSSLGRLRALRRRGAGRQGARHDRQGRRPHTTLGEPSGRPRPLRPCDRRRPVDRARAGHARRAADDGRGRPRRPDRAQARELRDFLADPRSTGYVAVALPEELPVREALELEQKLPAPPARAFT